VGDVEELASILCCRVSLLLMKYFVLSFGALYKATSIWNGIIEKNGMLVGWKEYYLCKASRLTFFLFFDMSTQEGAERFELVTSVSLGVVPAD
jgi:hypothetical protein